MKVKHALFILVFGFLIVIFGTISKIIRFLYADEILLFGLLIEVLGAVLLLYKVFSNPKVKDFLNS